MKSKTPLRASSHRWMLVQVVATALLGGGCGPLPGGARSDPPGKAESLQADVVLRIAPAVVSPVTAKDRYNPGLPPANVTLDNRGGERIGLGACAIRWRDVYWGEEQRVAIGCGDSPAEVAPGGKWRPTHLEVLHLPIGAGTYRLVMDVSVSGVQRTVASDPVEITSCPKDETRWVTASQASGASNCREPHP